MPVRLRYESPLGCPSADAFAQAVFGRTARARPAGTDEPAHEFEIRLRGAGGRFVGNFILREAGNQSQRGPFTGKTCEEVADAIAFSVAITIDPEAAAKPTALPTSSAAPPEPSAAAPLPTPANVPAPPPAPDPKTLDTTPRNAAPPAIAPAGTIQVNGGLHVIARTGIAGHAAMGPGLFVGWGLPQRQWLAPSLRVWGLAAAQTDADAAPTGHARFRWLLGRVDPCPFRFGSGGVSVMTCGIFEGGVVFAEGVDVENAQSARSTWLAGGGGARVGLRTSSTIGLEIEVDGLAPLRRDSFQFGPRDSPPSDSMKVPGLVLEASVGAAYPGL